MVQMISKSELNKEVQNIVNQLVDLYQPEKIILFGSLSKKDEIKDGTDIDLFVVKDNVPEYGADRIRELDRLTKYRLATDFIVYKPDELKKRLQLGDPFVKHIFSEGRVLYDVAA